MSGGDPENPQDAVQNQATAATNQAVQGALDTLAAAAEERDRILSQFQNQKEKLEYQLQQQRAHAMHYVEQTRAATQAQTGAPSGGTPSPGTPSPGTATPGMTEQQQHEAGQFQLTPEQQFIAGVKMLIHQDTRPYEVPTENQTQAALLLLDALKKTIHQEINALLQRAQAQEEERLRATQEAATASAASDATAESGSPDSEDGMTEPGSAAAARKEAERTDAEEDSSSSKSGKKAKDKGSSGPKG